MPEGLLFILSGPSGVGKDAAIKLMQQQRFPMHYAVTATTRPIRENEIAGKDYIFLSQDEFEGMLERDDFLEHADVYGKCYGTPKNQVLEPLAKGQDVLLKVDVQGADTVKDKMPHAIRIFLAPASFEELKERLESRLTESPEALLRRLREAEAEMAHAGEFDYVVYNRAGELEAAVREIQDIVLKEKARVEA
ncbi:MAG TPA: guanylate kinase [Chloroflexota bacterium]|jgi:guanylate kinase|nr:guanylate kinase [Chloroflexota bacterium]